MRRTALVLAGALTGALLVASPATAASYTVTATLSKTAPDVGSKTTVSGKVTGSGSGKKTLTVELRLGTGSWKKVATTKTSSKGTYSYAFKVTKVGDQALRVVAPKKGKTGTGTSPAATLAGYTWLFLTDQPHVVSGDHVVGSTVTVGGNAYERSIEMYPSSNTSVTWALDGKCNASDIDVALFDGAGGSEPVGVETEDGGTTKYAVSNSLTGANVATSVSDYLYYERDADGATVLLLSPRLHCKTNRLSSLFF